MNLDELKDIYVLELMPDIAESYMRDISKDARLSGRRVPVADAIHIVSSLYKAHAAPRSENDIYSRTYMTADSMIVRGDRVMLAFDTRDSIEACLRRVDDMYLRMYLEIYRNFSMTDSCTDIRECTRRLAMACVRWFVDHVAYMSPGIPDGLAARINGDIDVLTGGHAPCYRYEDDDVKDDEEERYISEAKYVLMMNARRKPMTVGEMIDRMAGNDREMIRMEIAGCEERASELLKRHDAVEEAIKIRSEYISRVGPLADDDGYLRLLYSLADDFTNIMKRISELNKTLSRK